MRLFKVISKSKGITCDLKYYKNLIFKNTCENSDFMVFKASSFTKEGYTK